MAFKAWVRWHYGHSGGHAVFYCMGKFCSGICAGMYCRSPGIDVLESIVEFSVWVSWHWMFWTLCCLLVNGKGRNVDVMEFILKFITGAIC